mmetsp:Transcript_102649/g.162203  ORF Transcript_102649/g.162203 Transcript_102649/m.162203 type:complete len:184 (+) Transcript_102649:82-633(+)|eukprot:CAMPEP_0169119866 /NCGR_PEP_ID=MMETSP1015-20121227/31794_1 /TAXON_ID=342587 /ORGANISM="Karlodinium micrum, Strain CCMP2283" /LENGTH=183 /DNA_ID=CAMNT_0009182793 /DNA_START=82 /DNA_END=633 /DNA_ORIENTATION=-
MAATLVDSMNNLTLKCDSEAPELLSVEFKVSGLTTFSLELEVGTAVRDVKKFAKEHCKIEPEHMRLIYKGRELKEGDLFEEATTDEAVQIHFTAGHTALNGGGCMARSSTSTGQPGVALRGMQGQPQNAYHQPVRGIPGSKGQRVSRMSGRRGGMALIRKYGIMMKRQEFREKAEEIGFRKYR